jgi:hypothetical protein
MEALCWIYTCSVQHDEIRPRSKLYPTVDQVPTTIRKPFRVVSRPIGCIESNRYKRFSIAPLVVTLELKCPGVTVAGAGLGLRPRAEGRGQSTGDRL